MFDTSLVLKVVANESPEQTMVRLGAYSLQVMSGRVDAQRRGMDAIHDALCQVSNEITRAQETLLAANPELVFMCMKVK